MSTAKRIMIVDDHVVIRRAVCSLFANQGFEVCTAENGSDAIKKAQELHPDLIVLDLAMPVMNGLEAARALKLLMPQVPLVMFTSTVGKTMEQEARTAGISAVVSKDEPAQQLFDQVEALLP